MLRIERTTGQVLCEVLMSPNGFIPLVLNANLIFLGSTPKFGEEPRNVRFASSTGGMNLFGDMSTSHSTCLVVLSILNIPS